VQIGHHQAVFDGVVAEFVGRSKRLPAADAINSQFDAFAKTDAPKR